MTYSNSAHAHTEPEEYTSGKAQRIFSTSEHSKLLVTKKAAEYINISVSEFRKRETEGIYKATVVKARGKINWKYYSVEYLNTLTNNRNTKVIEEKIPIISNSNVAVTKKVGAKTCFYTSEISTRVIAELEKGTRPIDIVVDLGILPEVFKEIHQQWIDLNSIHAGGFHISQKIVDEINTLPLEGDYPITNEAQLLANMKEIAKSTINNQQLCRQCKKQPRQVCIACAVASDPSE